MGFVPANRLGLPPAITVELRPDGSRVVRPSTLDELRWVRDGVPAWDRAFLAPPFFNVPFLFRPLKAGSGDRSFLAAAGPGDPRTPTVGKPTKDAGQRAPFDSILSRIPPEIRKELLRKNVLDPILREVSKTGLRLKTLVNLAVALAICASHLDPKPFDGERLGKILESAFRELKSLGLTKEQSADRLARIARNTFSIFTPKHDTICAFEKAVTIVTRSIQNLRSGGWPAPLTDRFLFLPVTYEGINALFDWLDTHLDKTLEVFKTTDLRLQDQFLLLAMMSNYRLSARKSLSDNPGEIFSLDEHNFSPELLGEGIRLMQKLSRALEGEGKATEEPAEDGVSLLREAREEVMRMLLYPSGTEPIGLLQDLFRVSQDAFWLAIKFLKEMDDRGVPLAKAHEFLGHFTLRLSEVTRIPAFTLLLKWPDQAAADLEGLMTNFGDLTALREEFLGKLQRALTRLQEI